MFYQPHLPLIQDIAQVITNYIKMMIKYILSVYRLKSTNKMKILSLAT